MTDATETVSIAVEGAAHGECPNCGMAMDIYPDTFAAGRAPYVVCWCEEFLAIEPPNKVRLMTPEEKLKVPLATLQAMNTMRRRIREAKAVKS
jgi:hypothetical protein